MGNKSIIIINDMRALPVSAALSIFNKTKKNRTEIWLSESIFEYNDYGQIDGFFLKKIKLMVLKLLSDVRVIPSSNANLNDFDTGIDSSLKSITCDSMGAKGKYIDKWGQLYKLSEGALSIAERIKNEKCNVSEVFLFNGRTASSYPISKICIEENIKIFFYEYSPEKYSYKLLPFPIHNLPAISKSVIHYYEFGLGGVSEIYRMGFDYVNKKLRNDFVESYRFSVNKTYDVVIFLSSPHEYMALDRLLCDISYIDEVSFVSSVVAKYGADKSYAIRCHPNQKSDPSWEDYFQRLSEYCSDNDIDFYSPCDDVSSYDLIRAASNVVVDISSIGVDAFFLGAKVDVVGSPAYKDGLYYVINDESIATDEKDVFLGGMISNFEKLSSCRLLGLEKYLYFVLQALGKVIKN